MLPVLVLVHMLAASGESPVAAAARDALDLCASDAEGETFRQRAAALEFGFWGAFHERVVPGGSVSLTPVGDGCGLEVLAGADEPQALDRALNEWSADRGLSWTVRDRSGPHPDGGALNQRERGGGSPSEPTLQWSWIQSEDSERPVMMHVLWRSAPD